MIALTIDPTPHIVDESDMNARWSGWKDGRTFRCTHCGIFFVLGMTIRWVYANHGKSSWNYGNFFVCEPCWRPDIIEVMAARYQAAKNTHWWMMNSEDLPGRNA